MSSTSERAVAVYRDEYNCAQAILSVYGIPYGLDESLAKKVSTGFGAGTGRSGGMCGAVAGAIMVLGLKYGMADSANQEEKQITYEKVRQLLELFGERNGSTNCTELLECDLTTPEGFQKAQEKKLLDSVCEKLVADAGEILEQLLSDY